MLSQMLLVVGLLGGALLAATAPVATAANETGIEPFAESHRVEIINRCGRGQGVFLFRDNATPRGSTTINGPLYGGVAWMDGYANCGSSGVGCGIVEFTLISPGTDGANSQNSADYSLMNSGSHQFKYPMNFYYTGGCNNGAPGQCTGASTCPGAFWGDNPASGSPVNCMGANTGVS